MQRATLEKVVTALVLLAGLALLGPYFGLSFGGTKQLELEPASGAEETLHSESQIADESNLQRPEETKSNPLSEIDDLLK